MSSRFEDQVNQILPSGSIDAWKALLDTCTMQEAVYAHLQATRKGNVAMRMLAHKRVQHLDGELRHPDLWP